MAAVFPLDTSKPWVFNGVTYEYNAAEDRWFVVSTTATDDVVAGINQNKAQIDILDSIIDQEVDNRTALLNSAAAKNNRQDAAIAELDTRMDAIGDAVGILEFKAKYIYVLEKTSEACMEAYAQCLLNASGDPIAASDCQRLKSECDSAISDPYPTGTFTSKGTTNVIEDVEEFILTGVDRNGQVIDWINLVEVDDYLEFFEDSKGDSALYQVIEEPKIYTTERSIRVKFLSETGLGDGNFNLQELYEVRVIKNSVGIDINEADQRYQLKPYSVLFEDDAPTTGNAPDGVLRNGELWYDTQDLDLFVWNNNAWISASKPPSQDVVVMAINAQVDALNAKAAGLEFDINALVQDRVRSPHLYYSDDQPAGNAEGDLIDGDLWVDSDDLTIKFYSQGQWINPDRTSTSNDYLPLTSGTINGKVSIYGVGDNSSLYLKQSPDLSDNNSIITAYNKDGEQKFYVTGSGSVAASDSFNPSLDRHLTTKKYVDAMAGPTRCTWIHSNVTEPTIVGSKKFYISGSGSQGFLYISDTTANNIRFEKSTSTWGTSAHQWNSYVGQAGIGQMAWWMLNDDGSWSYKANSTAYKYRFNFRGWCQIEYKNFNGTKPSSSTYGKTWGISIPELF